MGAAVSTVLDQLDALEEIQEVEHIEPTPQSVKTRGAHGLIIQNKNRNVSYLHGQGNIHNDNRNITNFYAHPLVHPALLDDWSQICTLSRSDVNISATLPAMPIVFHGRDTIVDDAVGLLTAPGTARLAILGAGGIGKTSVALAILHDKRIIMRYGGPRYFLSCEALVGTDAMIVSLAKLFGLRASEDLLTDIFSHLASTPRVLLVLDNLETIWLAGGGPVAAVDGVLGRLAQIPSLSVIITCRGSILPPSVKWSNVDSAALEPFSLDAALKTFQDRAGRRLVGTDEDIAKQLVDAVDKMPLAVSLLGQLAQHGNTVLELLDRWNDERSSLLRAHGDDRANNVAVSIGLSIKMVCDADKSQEALHLLSLCSILPDGLRPGVFQKLRSQFTSIYRARDTLSAYALVNIDANRVLKALSPIRYLVLELNHAQPAHHDALCLIYFDIADQLPTKMNEQFKQLAKAALPEMGNLSSLLLSLVTQPSQRLVDAVITFTRFMYMQQPTTTLLSALLPHLEAQPRWMAECLFAMGSTQYELNEYEAAIESFATATTLYLQLGDRASAAECKSWAGEVYRVIDQFNVAQALLDEARAEFAERGDEIQKAQCMLSLSELMRERGAYASAIEHLEAAREIYVSHHERFFSAQCSQFLGNVYLAQDRLDSAVDELETARLEHIDLGQQSQLAQCTRLLAQAYRQKKEFRTAEELLSEAEALCADGNNRSGLANCALERGRLRREQERWEKATARQFDSERPGADERMMYCHGNNYKGRPVFGKALHCY